GTATRMLLSVVELDAVVGAADAARCKWLLATPLVAVPDFSANLGRQIAIAGRPPSSRRLLWPGRSGQSFAPAVFLEDEPQPFVEHRRQLGAGELVAERRPGLLEILDELAGPRPREAMLRGRKRLDRITRGRQLALDGPRRSF